MTTLQKPSITLGGVTLAASAGIAWRYVSGVAPYTTTMQVHTSGWERLKGEIGKPLELKIRDSRGHQTTIKEVYILHLAPSDSPHRVTFVVSDRRWLWGYKLIVRDYNMPRKTGDRTAFQTVPVETQTVVDRFDYYPYSLTGSQNNKRWTAKEAAEDVLKLLVEDDYTVESWPVIETEGGGGASDATFTLQGVTLRDAGDMALSRLLGYIPGADIWVNDEGKVVVYDAADLGAAKTYYERLPRATYAGEAAVMVDRSKIRPSKVLVYYQREMEVRFDFADDYRTQPAVNNLVYSEPYLENVLPTVDPSTTLFEFDSELREYISKDVPSGTWVPVHQWLDAMNQQRPVGSLPWTFETIRIHWLAGDLDGVLGGGNNLDLDEDGSVSARVQALKQHFRQTFRINASYMLRARDLLPIRAGLLDPVSGARAVASVWGQAAVIPSTKGRYMAARGTGNPADLAVCRNVDYLARSTNGGTPLVQTAPGPAGVSIIDRDIGVFRIEWVVSPYDTVQSFVPCHLVTSSGTNGFDRVASITRDLVWQDRRPMSFQTRIDGGSNGILLAQKSKQSVIMTLIPAAPNNKRQFHKVEVTAADVAAIYRSEFGVQDGDGPELEVWVPPGELTARFAWRDDVAAKASIADVLGVTRGDDREAGIEGPEIPGYVLTNEERSIRPHAISLAAELLVQWADAIQGTVATRIPDEGLKMVGNMSGAGIRVAAAPSGKIDALVQFPGQQRQVSRHSLMPESTRQLVLGIVPFQDA